MGSETSAVRVIVRNYSRTRADAHRPQDSRGRICLALECGKPQRMSVRGGARFQRQYAGHEVTEYTDDLRVMRTRYVLAQPVLLVPGALCGHKDLLSLPPLPAALALWPPDGPSLSLPTAAPQTRRLSDALTRGSCWSAASSVHPNTRRPRCVLRHAMP